MAPPFDLGVASFDPHADRILLWTHVDAGAEVHWVIGRDPDIEDVVASGTATAGDSGAVTVDVDGLQPGTSYWYRFEAAGERSPVGRTRTLPWAGADRVRLAVVCCARYSQSTFVVYRAVAAADVDLVVHVGDYVYEDAKAGLPGRDPEPPHDAVTLDDYRRRHAQYRRDPDLQRAHAAHPFVVVWDDHDVADNACTTGAKSHDERRHGPWADRLTAALSAHHEFLPKRLADPADVRSAWRTFDAGSLLRLVCSETRASGRDLQAGLDGALPADDPGRSLLGDRQRAWLLPCLEDEGPAWTALVSGTVVSELEIDAPEQLDRVLPEKYAIVDGRGLNSDQWDGYRAERSCVAAAMAARAEAGRPNLVLSGDIHSAWVVEGPIGPTGHPVAVEVVCPPAATTPLGGLLPGELGAALGAALRRDVAGARWVDVDHHGFVTVDVTRDRLVASFWWVDPDGPGRPALGSSWEALATRPGRWFPVDADLAEGGAVRRHPWYRVRHRLVGAYRRRRERHAR